MSFYADNSHYMLIWTLLGFFMSGLLLLSCALYQLKRWNRELALFQTASSLLPQATAPFGMQIMLPVRSADGQMQVVEGERIDWP